MTQPPTDYGACHEYADRLVDFSDNELPADERDAVASHVAACPGCRAELVRLDASLACLRSGISSTGVVQPPRTSSASGLRWAAAVAAAGLFCLVSATWVAWRLAQPAKNVVHAVPAAEPNPVSKITQRDALWQIALIEQQARLQTSLDLMPADEWYGEQREASRQIVDKLREVAARGEQNL